MSFSISALPAGNGMVGISPAPGRSGCYRADLKQVVDWAPSLVVSMTETAELIRVGAAGLADDLDAVGIGWLHLPIVDFGAPSGDTLAFWPDASQRVQSELLAGKPVLIHCMGGCGRSGMAALRLLCEMEEAPPVALERLRATRPCAVETDDQLSWAFEGRLK